MPLSEEKREELTALFIQAYAPGSVSGGILEAIRPNNSIEWKPETEARNSDEHVASSVDQFLEATEILANRRDSA